MKNWTQSLIRSNNFKHIEISEEQLNKGQGFLPVIIAILGNLFITLMKFTGFFISGSAVLFSESVHSLADTFNQVLLMIGLRRSVKKGNKDFEYGYGKERFLWALISACGIFFIGAGVTIYHGFLSLLSEEHVIVGPIIFIILAISLVIESFSFAMALRELKKHRGDSDFWESLRQGDPVTIAVIYEDGIAVLGVIVAFISALLYWLTGNPNWDAAGSVIIGIMLGVMAIILISKNRSFLIEKSIPEEIRERVVELLEADPSIEKVLDFKSSILDINKYRIKCEVEFNGSALLRKIYRQGDLKEEYESVKNDYDEFIKFCAEYIDRAPRLIGGRIDEIEKKIKKEIPEIKHIDIEIN